jgi:hypothetical protein
VISGFFFIVKGEEDGCCSVSTFTFTCCEVTGLWIGKIYRR